MYSKELLVLDKVYSKPDVSQRELANSTGISLGQINQIIKDLSHEGLLRSDVISKKKLKYTLTQRGLAERVRLSNEGILLAIKSYRKVKGTIFTLLNSLFDKGYREFVLEGERGEMCEVIGEVFDNHFKDRAKLVWGPAEAKADRVVLNLDRRFVRDAINVLHEITV